MWDSAIELFRSYVGTGLIIGFFLVAVVYLFFVEKDKVKRLLFVYVPMLLLLLYFNPLFGELLYRLIGDEIYYRVLWLMPITLVLAYSVVKVCQTLQQRMRAVFLVMAALLIMISGSFVYKNIHFRKADNLYHIPQTVVDICEAIEVEGREVMAVFPREMIQYVRQYSAYVCMPYGREAIEAQWNTYDELQLVMEAEVLMLDKMAPLAKEKGCHYVIVESTKKMLGDLSKYDYELFDSIGGYDIYIDKSIYIGL